LRLGDKQPEARIFPGFSIFGGTMKQLLLTITLAAAMTGCSKTPSVGDYLKDRELRQDAMPDCAGKTSESCLNLMTAMELLTSFRTFGAENVPDLFNHVESVDEIQR